MYVCLNVCVMDRERERKREKLTESYNLAVNCLKIEVTTNTVEVVAQLKKIFKVW